jgi:hypothetical protein
MYSNSLPGYDSWLEAPYVDAARYADECERVAELLGLTDEEAEEFDFDAYFAEQEDDFDEPDFDDYDEDAAIHAAEDAYERSMGW